MSDTLGTKIKTARKSMNMTQKDLAEQLGVGNTTISNWEKSVSKPDIDQISAICQVLKVDPKVFLTPQQYDIEKHIFLTVRDGMEAIKDAVRPAFPTTVDPDLADYLEDLRERPETRALLEASRGMTKEQVEAMAAFAKQLRGDPFAD